MVVFFFCFYRYGPAADVFLFSAGDICLNLEGVRLSFHGVTVVFTAADYRYMTEPVKLAITYDFDGTLAFGNIQEYDLVPKFGMSPKQFWGLSAELSNEQNVDGILAYMWLILKMAKEKNVQIRREQFFEYGKNIRFYKGVDTWFDRINRYGKSKGVDVQHYIISSGLKEMIEGTKIARYFNRIFASCYMYDGEGNPIWPARAVNYTNKTQYIFRLNKGVLDERDDDSVNAYTPHKNRVLPFSQIVYIGDGATDIPCMRLVKNFGGFAIMIYQDEMPEKKQMAQKYLETGRISMISPNDYSPGSNLERGVKLIIDSVVAKARFNEINSLEFD